MLHLEFHHGVLAHLVSSGLWDIVDADQLGLVSYTITLKPAQQVLVCLLWNWNIYVYIFLKKQNIICAKNISSYLSIMRLNYGPIVSIFTFLLLFFKRDLGRGCCRGGRGAAGRGGEAGVGRDGHAVLHLGRHGAGGASLDEWTVRRGQSRRAAPRSGAARSNKQMTLNTHTCFSFYLPGEVKCCSVCVVRGGRRRKRKKGGR